MTNPAARPASAQSRAWHARYVHRSSIEARRTLGRQARTPTLPAMPRTHDALKRAPLAASRTPCLDALHPRLGPHRLTSRNGNGQITVTDELRACGVAPREWKGLLTCPSRS